MLYDLRFMGYSKGRREKMPENTRSRWVILSAIFYVFVAYAFAFQVVPPAISSIMKEFDIISHAQAGLLMTIVVIPGILLALPTGILVDRYGIRLIGLISTTLTALGCLITAVGISFNAILLGRLVLGMGGALMAIATYTIVPQWFPPQELGKAMGIYGIPMPLATVIAFPSSSVLILNYDWRYPFYVSTVLAVMAIGVFALFVKEGPLKAEKRKRSPSTLKALKKPELWKIGLVWLLFQVAALSFSTWTKDLMVEFRGMDPVFASSLASAQMFAAIPFVPLYGLISDKIQKRKPFVVIGSTLMFLTLTLIAYSPNSTLIPSIAALGIAAAMIPPMVMTLTPEILGPAQAGKGFGVITICANVGVALGPPIIGTIVDLTQSATLSYVTMAIFSAVGAIVAHTLKTR